MNAKCRFCNNTLSHTFVDLGMTPLANSYVTEQQTAHAEQFFPLHAYICDACYLVQLKAYAKPDEIFTEYAYFSSFSATWLNHAKRYVHAICERLALNQQSFVVEVASNDGYLLQYFKDRNIPHLGIEPAKNIADQANARGIKTHVDFFGTQLASTLLSHYPKADLIIANNVLAHVPDLNDFVAALKILLNDKGSITLEFPHLLSLIKNAEFDTIYHEHLCYFSLLTIEKIFNKHQLCISDVEILSTHGGSLRVYAQHAGAAINADNIEKIRRIELKHGLDEITTYLGFANKALEAKLKLLRYLTDAKGSGARICAYGAPAKGNTLLNYCGIGKEIIDFTVDKNPEKQGCLLPGSRIPIYAPEAILTHKPDIILILPWNLADEIAEQLQMTRAWQAKLVVPIPEMREL